MNDIQSSDVFLKSDIRNTLAALAMTTQGTAARATNHEATDYAGGYCDALAAVAVALGINPQRQHREVQP